MRTRFLIAAKEDVAATAFKLEHMRSGWGDAFDLEIVRAVATIESNPRLQPQTEDGPDEPENREYYISRFEIRVIYAIWKDEAVILAVAHAKQKPGRWLGRLTELE